ncbi:MAG TPA: hypothetical protein VGK44_01775 [Casimicrobiaceae bacterium]
MDHIEDGDHASHVTIQAQVARAAILAVVITVAAWMLTSYVFDTLGVPFLLK